MWVCFATDSEEPYRGRFANEVKTTVFTNKDLRSWRRIGRLLYGQQQLYNRTDLCESES